MFHWFSFHGKYPVAKAVEMSRKRVQAEMVNVAYGYFGMNVCSTNPRLFRISVASLASQLFQFT